MTDTTTLNAFILPSQHRHGTDLMSKLILRHPSVRNIIVNAVLDSEACPQYVDRPTEWPNGRCSDVLYAPIKVTISLPPVLVEMLPVHTDLTAIRLEDAVVDSVAMGIEKGEAVEIGRSRRETSPTVVKSRLPERTKTTTPSRKDNIIAFNTSYDSTSTASENSTDDSISDTNNSTIQQLFDFSGWHLTRQSFTPLYSILEESCYSLLADFSSGNRLPLTIRTNAYAMESETFAYEYRGSTGNTHFKMEGVPALRDIIEKDDYMQG
ncbi:MAG: hypothetical protein EXX96DRAFT_613418 [Benjaminiella poitrasii]|nr:MAG: hypothetical protein EXX96DRAFT_613418 [Benjaminiella poitrasii]